MYYTGKLIPETLTNALGLDQYRCITPAKLATLAFRLNNEQNLFDRYLTGCQIK